MSEGAATSRPAEARARPSLGAVRSSFAPWEDPTARPLVRFDGVVKRFGAETAVAGVDLAIYEREFFALLGPSGCGKTTLMRLLAGFETPGAGRVLLDGEDLAARPPHQRPVHMMFQSYALFPHLTVAQNVAFGLKQQRLPRREIADRVAEMLSLVRLEGLERRRPDQLSGGQRQRVGLARALAPRPRVLLLDEPLAALDRKLREETQFELIGLQQRLGLTFMIVTHDQEEAMVLADRIAVMREGRIVQVGRPADVYEAPASRYVADFVGEVNLFEGRIAAVDGRRVRLQSQDRAQGFEVEAEAPPPIGDAAWLAIRPEKMRIAEAVDPAASNQMAGRIADVGYLGEWTTYRVEIDGGRQVRCARANTARVDARPLGVGDAVWLSFAPDVAVLLSQ